MTPEQSFSKQLPKLCSLKKTKLKNKISKKNKKKIENCPNCPLSSIAIRFPVVFWEIA